MPHSTPRHIALLLMVAAWTPLFAQDTELAQSEPSQLSLERIYADDDFRTKRFAGRWLDNDQDEYVVLEDSTVVPGGKDMVKYDVEGHRQIFAAADLFVPDDESAPLSIEDYAFSSDLSLVLIYTNTKRVWRTHSRGDYWILDRSSRRLRQLARHAAPSTTQFAKISPDSSHVAYVIQGNIFVEDVRSGASWKITNQDSDQIINGTFDWVYEEEFGLRDGFRWSPDSKSIAYWQLDTSGVPVFTMINNTDTLYPELIRFAHPKTGQRNAACRVGIANATEATTVWLNVDGDQRENYIARMEWIDNRQLVLQQLNRLQNTNRVLFANRDGTVQPRYTDSDEAWVAVHDEMFWMRSNEAFTWISEKDGWRHVYEISRSDGSERLLTPGAMDVIELLDVDEAADRVYFIASPENAAQRYLYAARLDGTHLERLTPSDQPGTHAYRLSGNGRFAFHTASRTGSAPVTTLIQLPEHRVVKTLEKNAELQEKLDKLAPTETQFFRVDIGDGIELDGWSIHPPNFDPSKKYPLLVYVYGEPAGTTVVDRWGGSSYLWHRLMAQEGYVVMSFDNRGTRVPRGRAWRKSIYRQVGIIGPRDQAAAVRRVLRERPYLDANRVGVWGWSGGGSMSLNAIFKFPDLYRTAISIAPVPNQRYYDTIYQERYMGLPSDNAQGYIDGSPIHFAHQLKGNLLLIHGTGDDNCHYQTMEMLINQLILHDKHFTMMAYPNRTHSIREGKNTTLHLRRLMTRYLKENL